MTSETEQAVMAYPEADDDEEKVIKWVQRQNLYYSNVRTNVGQNR
jgi:hypothetical protein